MFANTSMLIFSSITLGLHEVSLFLTSPKLSATLSFQQPFLYELSIKKNTLLQLTSLFTTACSKWWIYCVSLVQGCQTHFHQQPHGFLRKGQLMLNIRCTIQVYLTMLAYGQSLGYWGWLAMLLLARRSWVWYLWSSSLVYYSRWNAGQVCSSDLFLM